MIALSAGPAYPPDYDELTPDEHRSQRSVARSKAFDQLTSSQWVRVIIVGAMRRGDLPSGLPTDRSTGNSEAK